LMREMQIVLLLLVFSFQQSILQTGATFLSGGSRHRSIDLVQRKQNYIDISLYATPPSDKESSSTTSVSSENDNTEETTRDSDFARYLRGLIRTGMKETIEVDSIVVARADIPSMGIYMDQSYELQSIYKQQFNDETNTVDRIPLQYLGINASGSDDAFGSSNASTTYIKLYSPVYHKDSGAVIVTPEEVGLVSLRTEVFDSIVFALPVLSFWTATCFVFAGQYNERYGGNFLDALLGR